MTDDLLDADVTNVRMIARSTARIRPPAHGTIESERSLAKITLVTGGGDKPYALGLAECLAGGSMTVDFIGSDAHEVPDILEAEHVNFLNFRGSQDASVSPVRKFLRVLWYYARLIRYSAGTDSRLFHVLWANRFLLLDRVLLMAFFRILGKKIAFTAHNVNERERDGGDDVWNRVTLRILYRLVHHIFVHTKRMQRQLMTEFAVPESKITVIPFGINDTLPKSDLTKRQARRNLQLDPDDKVLLFFGNIAAYKGLELAVEALARLRTPGRGYRLVIAGQVKGSQPYWESIERLIAERGLDALVTRRIEYIPDEDVEIFFKAADVLVLPYRFIYQSGVLFLSYSFGLPVIATDVGSLAEDVVDGRTGFMCRTNDFRDLANAIDRYFRSAMFEGLESNRAWIRDFATRTYSWEKVGAITRCVYGEMVGHEYADDTRLSR